MKQIGTIGVYVEAPGLLMSLDLCHEPKRVDLSLTLSEASVLVQELQRRLDDALRAKGAL